MNFIINKINKILDKILIKKFKIKKFKFFIYNNYLNNQYGDVYINLSTLYFLNSKQQQEIGYIIGKKIINKLKKYIKYYRIINNNLNIYYNNYFYLKIIKLLFKIKFNKLLISNKNRKKKILIDYLSPNSNKPLHLGHLRNIVIGNTLANIYKSLGYKVIESQIINDRGIHICKCILSYKLFFKNKKNIKIKKGDHFVGKLYIKFEKELNKEINYLIKKYNINKNEAYVKSKLLKLVNIELIKWENNNIKILSIWKKLNNLVYKGFKKTYNKLNIKFNEILYESKTYLLGKNKILENLNNIFFLNTYDKSIYYLYKNKKIIVLRKNGTSLYITQEIGTLLYRIKKHKKLFNIIYVVGNEQSDHFNIFFEIINKLKICNIKLYHYSYNTVNYLGKKIKSRRKINNIILIDELIKYLNKIIKKKFFNKKINKKKILNLSISAIKYEFLKINPKKIINFNINNILNLKGNTGIYIQYTYVRILSIVNKLNNYKLKLNNIKIILENNEKTLIKQLIDNKNIIKKTIKTNDTSILINYIYNISKIINNFYNFNKILKIKNLKIMEIRLIISKIILKFLYFNMKIINIPILKKI
ncbi:MAG: arginine--tRNA ligase [Candidatus Shikimatogenerans bostrichidophilus]|nr:MAG: arginine--tRNA ligase [Candidatus Shikimatogenerans bostrichidophilus]